MNYYGKLKEARFSDIHPEGKLRDLLIREKNGLPGHLDELGYPFHLPCWSSKEPVSTECARWWPYEQTAYWTDSLTRVSALLDDKELFEKVRLQVENAVTQADPYVGPNIIREQGPCYRWPHAVFFRALYAMWSKTGDQKYLKAMQAHFKGEPDYDYSANRNVMCNEAMLLVAAALDDKELLERAEANLGEFLKYYGPALEYFFYYCNGMPAELDAKNDHADMFTDIRCVFHGVSYNETAKLPAILYLYTGKREYLEASLKAYKVIEDRHLMADGVNSSGEFLCGNDSLAVHESCDVTDQTWSLGYLLQATGEAKYAEQIEQIMLNAYFGSQDDDYTTFQYFSALNQVVAARTTCYLSDFLDEKMAFQPKHNPQCCAGNLGRALPNMILRMYQEADDGVAVSLYGESTYGGSIGLRQSGGYPFTDEQTLTVTRAEKGKNVLRLRVPAWSVATKITVNGKAVDFDLERGYAKLTVKTGDVIVLKTEKQFESHPSTDGGIYFTYGPFLMALKIKEKVRRDTREARSSDKFPAYNIYPASKWAYAVSGYECPTLAKAPSAEDPVFEIKINARVLNGWDVETVRSPKGTKTYTPQMPDYKFVASHLGDAETITLVPYGSTRIRLTVFPRLKGRGTYQFAKE